MRYVLDFGAANAGGAPAFTVYKRLDTLADLAQPAISEIGGGQYYFEVDWSTVAATSITFKATLAGIELSDVVSSPSGSVTGTATASAAVSSLSGYSTVGTLINRAAVQCGLSAVADPFASADPNFVQFVELLNTLGTDLAGKLKAHLERELTLTTADSALSYALPADFLEMVDDTGRQGLFSLSGPVTPQRQQFLKAWNSSSVTRIPFRIQGNRITFPVDPGNGKTITGLYVSGYWIQTAASGTGPDADHATAASDYVLFDPLLVVLGLKLRWLEAKGFDTAMATTAYEDRLEYAKGKNTGGAALSLTGGYGDWLLSDSVNLPPTGWGI